MNRCLYAMAMLIGAVCAGCATRSSNCYCSDTAEIARMRNHEIGVLTAAVYDCDDEGISAMTIARAKELLSLTKDCNPEIRAPLQRLYTESLCLAGETDMFVDQLEIIRAQPGGNAEADKLFLSCAEFKKTCPRESSPHVRGDSN